MDNLKTFVDLSFKMLKSRIIKKRVPVFLSLFITNRCNLRCKYCFVIDEGLDKKILHAEYSKEEVFRIVDEFYDMGTRMIFMLGGEPLVHNDIGEVINYIVCKGIYLHVVTNGTLIKKKLEEIKNAHVLCVSLDGIEEINDSLRGAGTFRKAIEGVKTAVAAGIPTRVHAVLTRNNLKSIRRLAELCGELKISLSISPPNFLGETVMPELRITRDEYKEFWKEYYEMYREGLPIANVPGAIRKCIDWPVDYHEFIKAGERHEGYKPTFCMNGYTYAALGAEGTMYNCINLGPLNGPNIHEIGIRAAWDKLLEWRPGCVSCASINCIETALMLNLSPESILSGLNFHAKRK